MFCLQAHRASRSGGGGGGGRVHSLAEVDDLLLTFCGPLPPDQGPSHSGPCTLAVLPCGIGWPLNHRRIVPAEDIYLAGTRIHQQTCLARKHKYQFKKLLYDTTARR